MKFKKPILIIVIMALLAFPLPVLAETFSLQGEIGTDIVTDRDLLNSFTTLCNLISYFDAGGYWVGPNPTKERFVERTDEIINMLTQRHFDMHTIQLAEALRVELLQGDYVNAKYYVDVIRMSIQDKMNQPPEVCEVSPTSGLPGTKVTISGHNFCNIEKVMFGDIPCHNYTIKNRYTITATVPGTISLDNVGEVSITITTAKGTSEINSNVVFNYTYVEPEFKIRMYHNNNLTEGNDYDIDTEFWLDDLRYYPYYINMDWESSNPEVAYVCKYDGIVYRDFSLIALKPGQATIRAIYTGNQEVEMYVYNGRRQVVKLPEKPSIAEIEITVLPADNYRAYLLNECGCVGERLMMRPGETYTILAQKRIGDTLVVEDAVVNITPASRDGRDISYAENIKYSDYEDGSQEHEDIRMLWDWECNKVVLQGNTISIAEWASRSWLPLYALVTFTDGTSQVIRIDFSNEDYYFYTPPAEITPPEEITEPIIPVYSGSSSTYEPTKTVKDETEPLQEDFTAEPTPNPEIPVFKPVTLELINCLIENNRALIKTCNLEQYGIIVGWEEATRHIMIMYKDTQIILSPDSPDFTVNGQSFTLPVPVKIIEGRSYVPLRVIAENLGFTVDYDNDTRQITIH